MHYVNVGNVGKLKFIIQVYKQLPLKVKNKQYTNLKH